MNFEIPDWAKNIAMHAASGFAIGFLTAIVASQQVDFLTAVKGALIIGAYGACKEVLAYLQPKTTAAKGPMVEKKLHERML